MLRGRPLEAVAVFLISGLWVGDHLLGVLVDRPAPSSELIGVIDLSRSDTFPSGHITGAAAFYGLLSFLTLGECAEGPSGVVVVPVLSVLIIGLASVGRVYASAHWPSDILGSYLLAFIGVVAIASVYTSVKEDRFHLPRLRRKEPAPEMADGVKIAHSIASNRVSGHTSRHRRQRVQAAIGGESPSPRWRSRPPFPTSITRRPSKPRRPSERSLAF